MIVKKYTHDAIVFNYFFAQKKDRNSFNRGSRIFYEGERLYSYGYHFELAVKCQNYGYVLNGDTYSSTTSHHQWLTRDIANKHKKQTSNQSMHHCIIPFSSLQGAGIKPEGVVILDVTEDTYTSSTRKNPKTGEIEQYQIHHLGASLIRVGTKRYLSSIDASATRGGAYFLVELKSCRVNTVEDAFRDLAGNLTDDQYEKYQQGIILRQGEYFLEPCTVKTRQLKKKAKKTAVKVSGVLDVKVKNRHSKRCVNEVIRRENMGYGGCHREQIQVIRRKGVPYYVLLERDYAGMQIPKDSFIKDGHLVTRESLVHQFDLSNGVGNLHVARDAIKTSGGIFIRGTLRHNQHRMIKMRNIWHRVIKNTAIDSWSSSGNVD